MRFAPHELTRAQMPTARNIDNLLKDLKEVLAQVKNSPAASGDMVALYGTLHPTPPSRRD